MDRSPEFYRRVMRLALELEAVRVGLCLFLMAGLGIFGLPWWLAVLLPLPAYAGLRFLGPAPASSQVPAIPSRSPIDEQEAYRRCQRLRAEITLLGQQISHEENAKRVRAVDDRFGQILAVIAEDAKYSMSVPLLDLVGTTHDLLSRYVKNVRRHLDDDETHAGVRGNLETIDHTCARLWRHVNIDAVIGLEAMIETINATLKELDTPMEEAPPSIAPPVVHPDVESTDTGSEAELPDDEPVPVPNPEETDTLTPSLDELDPLDQLDRVEKPPALPSGPIVPVPPNGPCQSSLTPREVEVLCLLVDGCSNREIADNLCISEGTTKRHVTNILAKLDVPSRSAAAAYANKRGVCRDPRLPA